MNSECSLLHSNPKQARLQHLSPPHMHSRQLLLGRARGERSCFCVSKSKILVASVCRQWVLLQQPTFKMHSHLSQKYYAACGLSLPSSARPSLSPLSFRCFFAFSFCLIAEEKRCDCSQKVNRPVLLGCVTCTCKAERGELE